MASEAGEDLRPSPTSGATHAGRAVTDSQRAVKRPTGSGGTGLSQRGAPLPPASSEGHADSARWCRAATFHYNFNGTRGPYVISVGLLFVCFLRRLPALPPRAGEQGQ